MSRKLSKGWRRVRLGEVVQERPEFITVWDERVYKRITLRLRNQGIALRDEVHGHKLRTKKQRVVRAGDLVVAEIDAKMGGFGIAPPETEGAIVSSHYYLFTVDQAKCDLGYLDACIRKGMLHRQVFAVGSTNYAAIRSRDVLDYRIPLPPMSDQKRIADALRVMDDAIRANEEVLECTRAFKKSLAHELLTRGIPGRHTRFKDSPLGKIPAEWEVKRLGDVAGLSSGGTPARGNPSYWGGKILWVKTGEIDFNIIEDTEEKITQTGLDNSAAKIVPRGAILMALYGQGKTRGKVARLGKPAATNQACAVIEAPEDLDADYLYHYLAANYLRFRALSNDGSQKNLSLVLIRDFPVPIPTKGEQQEIASTLEACVNQTPALECTRESLDATKSRMRDALLAGALGGAA
ncbi:MAG: restriction endonuclease subunit S [Chrysiogenetes bacterium]|nr:restriction endonuclease subunit S [Chrysiogenetes bacterium]